jgi:hypothetical protein
MSWVELSFLLDHSRWASKTDYLARRLRDGQSMSPLTCPVHLGWPVKIQGKGVPLRLVVLITAAGLQGVQPLVDRTM